MKNDRRMYSLAETHLRVDLHHCGTRWKKAEDTYCTYPSFIVHDAASQYAVEIVQPCAGSEHDYEDGWLRWDQQIGPKFSAFDSPDSHCARLFRNTGWWYDTENHCGSADLNGSPYNCSNKPSIGDLIHYMKWN
ncbi:unnamed protein product, partial [Anisakis simplex]|uniref:Ricin B-type lectin domain-containing protein n=1 Tax=Anisakis simplex TaxID=6269 RepID=A0A0M3JHY7_ANISI